MNRNSIGLRNRERTIVGTGTIAWTGSETVKGTYTWNCIGMRTRKLAAMETGTGSVTGVRSVEGAWIDSNSV